MREMNVNGKILEKFPTTLISFNTQIYDIFPSSDIYENDTFLQYHSFLTRLTLFNPP